MKTKNKLCSIVVASMTLFSFLILISSTASATTVQNSLSTGPYAYITNYGSDSVSVIDTATDTVTATVPVGAGPSGVAVNPTGTEVYVANFYSNDTTNNSTISIIDTTTNTVRATVPVENYPWGIAVTPDGTKVYVANYGSSSISVIDAATKKVTATVPVGYNPYGVAINPTGTKVYVVNFYSNSVSVIDTATNKVTATVNVGKYPYGVAVSPDGTKVYVANSNNNNISVINTTTNAITAIVPVGSYPYGVAITPDGTKVYVANYGSNSISVINTTTNAITATVPVGSYPHGVAITPDGTKVYVANYGSNSISVINTTTNAITATVPVGNYPIALGQFIGSLRGQPVVTVANFTVDKTEGYAPLNVKFTDKSTNSPTGWKWNFGDNRTSTDQNPEHTFSGAGVYNVTLIATNGDGSSGVKSMGIKVNRAPTPPVANFTANKTEGTIPLTVKFTDASTNSPTGWKWDFGDGNTSNDANPSHTYATAGKFIANLTVSNADGTDITSNTITASEAVLGTPKASFTATPQTGRVPLTVKFTDKSTNATSLTWDFGDKTAISTESNPSHTYKTAGFYIVKLTVTNGDKSSVASKLIIAANVGFW